MHFFSLLSLLTLAADAALAATSTASFAPRQVNGTSYHYYYPTASSSGSGSRSSKPAASGTISLRTSGTPKPTSLNPSPFSAAAAGPTTHMADSALGLVVVGGVVALLL